MGKDTEKLDPEVYPDGKMNAEDEGVMQLAVGHENGQVMIRFPKPVHWFGFPPAEVRELCRIMLKHAEAIDGEDWRVEPMLMKQGRR